MEAEGKRVVLWLADNPSWAYASIVRQVGARLPQYEHRVYYLTLGAPQDGLFLEDLLRSADVVVSMFVEYARITAKKDNMALMLT